MTSKMTPMRKAALVAALAALPFGAVAHASDIPAGPYPMFAGAPPPPGAPPAPAGWAGCYDVIGGMPGGYLMSFCLTPDRDGSFRIAGPDGDECENRVDWTDRADFVHVDLRNLVQCDHARRVVSNDMNCELSSGGMWGDLACTFNPERRTDGVTVYARRVY